MRRSELLKVAVYCPHFKRTVTADKNAAIDRLVSCSDGDLCRDPQAAESSSDHGRPYPRGCPVYPHLAK